MASAADRQRRRRHRARKGKAVLRVEVDYNRLVTAILNHGTLSEEAALSRSRVEDVAAQMIEEVIALYS